MRYPEGVDVGLQGVRLTLEHLGGHPVVGALYSRVVQQAVGNRLRQAEVCDFQVHLGVFIESAVQHETCI